MSEHKLIVQKQLEQIELIEQQEQKEKKEQIEAIKAVYKICIETRNFEIGQLLQRNNFFMLFQGVLLAAALQNQASKPIVELLICTAGIFISIYQLQMASGAKFWQEWWESRVDHYENMLATLKKEESQNFYDLFAVPFERVHETIRGRITKERRWSLSNFLILQAYSVGRAPIKVSLVLTFAWIGLFLHSIDFSHIPDLSTLVKGFAFPKPDKL